MSHLVLMGVGPPADSGTLQCFRHRCYVAGLFGLADHDPSRCSKQTQPLSHTNTFSVHIWRETCTASRAKLLPDGVFLRLTASSNGSPQV